MENILFSWSGGKDSAMALHIIKRSGKYNITGLLTTVTEEYNRISMHGVRTRLLEKQARSLGYTLIKLLIPSNGSMEDYESKLRDLLLEYKARGIDSVVFGDIFLEDLKKYREDKLSKVGMKAIFPLWGMDTSILSKNFIKLGFKATITCIDSSCLDPKMAGRNYDDEFLSEIPFGVDSCGENGEFHSFVTGGPIFGKDIRFKKGDTITKDGRFYFCDLLPA